MTCTTNINLDENEDEKCTWSASGNGTNGSCGTIGSHSFGPSTST